MTGFAAQLFETFAPVHVPVFIMQTPDDRAGYLTEKLMQAINLTLRERGLPHLEVPREYNAAFEAIYDTLSKEPEFKTRA